MKLKRVSKSVNLDALYRDFETDVPITEDVMIEVLNLFNNENDKFYSATILTKDDEGHSRQYEFFGDDVYKALKDKEIYPEFINAFYVNIHTGHYNHQVNMYLNSKTVHYIISRKASRDFNRKKELREENGRQPQ